MTTRSHRGRDTWVQPTLLAVIASLVVLYRINTFGLWADEAFSVSTSLRSWPDLLRLSVTKETNGFLYAVVLKVWALFGTSELWLRLPSAMAFVAAVALTWNLGRRIHSEPAGVIAGVLLMVNGSMLQYGQNIRYYAPVVAVGLWFVSAVLVLLDNPSRRHRWGVAMLGAALPLIHLVAATLLAAAAVLIVVDSCVSPLQRSSPPINSTDRAVVRIRGLLVPLIPGFLLALVVAALVSSRDEGQSINLPFGRGAVAEVLLFLSGSGGKFGLVGYGLMLGAGFLTLRRAMRERAGRGLKRLDIAVPWVVVVTAVGLVTIGSLVTPLLAGRYVLFVVPYLALAGAIGVVTVVRAIDTSSSTTIRRLGGMTLPAASPQPWGAARLISALVLSLTVLVGVTGAANGARWWMTSDDRTDWRPLARTLLAEAGPNDAVLFANDSTRLFVEYQLRRSSARRPSAPHPVFPPQPWGEYRTGDQRYEPFSAAEVEGALHTYARTWLVVEEPLVDEPFADLLVVLTEHRPLRTMSFERTGTIYVLAPPAAR